MCDGNVIIDNAVYNLHDQESRKWQEESNPFRRVRKLTGKVDLKQFDFFRDSSKRFTQVAG